MKRMIIIAGALAALAAVTAAEAARATFPGSPGKIAFVSVRDANQEIYVMNADGSGQTRLTFSPGSDRTPSWSPDGTKIAYVGQGGFFVLDMKTGVARTVAQGQDFFFGDLLWLK